MLRCISVAALTGGGCLTVHASDVVSTWAPQYGQTAWSTYYCWTHSPALPQVPGAYPHNGYLGLTYDVRVSNNATVYLDADTAIDKLSWNTPNGFQSSFGSGPWRLDVNSSLDFKGKLSKITVALNGGTFAATLSDLYDATLLLAGTGTLSSCDSTLRGGASRISIETGGNATFLNTNTFERMSGTGQFDIKGTVTLAGTSTSFDSYWTVNVLAGGSLIQSSGTTTVQSIISDGSITIGKGSLSLLMGSAPCRLGGTIDVQSGGTLNLKNTVINASSVTGGGVIQVQSGTVWFESAVDMTPSLKIPLNTTVKINAPLRVRGLTELGSGVLSGSANATLDNLKWTGGTMGAAGVTIPEGGVFNISDSGTKFLNNCNFLVSGTATFEGTIGAVTLQHQGTVGSSFTIGPTGSLTSRYETAFTGFKTARGTNPFVNQGTITLDMPSWHQFSTNSGWDFNNFGTIRLIQGRFSAWNGQNTGSIDFACPGQHDLNNMNVGGSVAIASGAELYVGNGGRFAPTALTNNGRIVFNNAILFDSPLLLPGYISFGLSTSTISTTLSASGTVSLASGNLSGTGSLTVASLTAVSPVVRTNLILAPGGNMAMSGTMHLGGGSFTLNGQASRGVFRSTDPAAPASVTIGATGTLSVGGTNLASFITGGADTSGTLSNAGLLQASNGATVKINAGWALNNSGTIRLTSASIGVYTAGWTNTGQIELNSGAAAVFGGGDVDQLLEIVGEQLRSGFANGSWSGTGLTSLDAKADSRARLGYALASEILSVSGTQTAQWHNQTVDSSSVLVLYTLAGDSDLNGSVDFFDLTALAAHYGTAASRWSQGDFNYDGRVDFFDLTTLASAYGTALAGATPVPSGPFNSDLQAAFAGVPEPSPIRALAGVAIGLSLARRGRRSG